LSEDFAGVTEEAGAELERRLQEQLRAAAEEEARLPGLRERWEDARRRRAWTVEWQSKQGERQSFQSGLPAVEAARGAVDAAARAAGVIPLLDHADDARGEDGRRQEALRGADSAREERLVEHQAAAAALGRAKEAAVPLPELRRRLVLLNVAKGKLGL